MTNCVIRNGRGFYMTFIIRVGHKDF
jgi:hypothetical protein